MLLYILFAHDVANHFVKNSVITKDSRFCIPDKTIHSQMKYIIMDYFDQEAKKSRCPISLIED